MSDIQNKKTANSRFIRSRRVEWVFINLPFVCYLALLGVVYIFNAHSAERSLRKIDALKKEVKDYQWEHLSLKQELMYGGTQSQLGLKLKDSGLRPLESTPKTLSADPKKK